MLAYPYIVRSWGHSPCGSYNWVSEIISTSTGKRWYSHDDPQSICCRLRETLRKRGNCGSPIHCCHWDISASEWSQQESWLVNSKSYRCFDR